jgi:hypothetical protein
MPVSSAEKMALQAAHPGRAWAHILQLRHQRGADLNRNQVRCYQAALGLVEGKK